MLRPLWAALAATSVLALGACGQTTTEAQDESQLEQDLEQAGDEIEQAAESAGQDIEQAGEEIGQAAKDATDGDPNTNP
jgi:hypothetical protein